MSSDPWLSFICKKLANRKLIERGVCDASLWCDLAANWLFISLVTQTSVSNRPFRWDGASKENPPILYLGVLNLAAGGQR